MSSQSLKIMVIRGDTIQIENIITDFDGAALEPDSHSIQLYTPAGVAQGSAETSPTGSGGSYYQRFLIPADGAAGEWMVQWKATVTGAGSSTERIKFRVVA